MTRLSFEIRHPKFSIQKIKALIFDLDDTLYFIPSGAQFFRYGEHLSQFLPENKRKVYLHELGRSQKNGSPVKVGRAFDSETNWILEFDDHWLVQKAFYLNGTEIPEITFRKKFPSHLNVEELRSLIHLSSGWGVPSALGRLHGLGREHFRKAYLATREDMTRYPDQFPVLAAPEIQSFLSDLHEHGTLLLVMTNSDLKDAEGVLEKLTILPYFHKIYAEARKPNQSLSIFQDITKTFNLRYSELLVIGDSVYNDLRDAKNIGAQTVLIERFPNQPLGEVDVRVWDLDGFIELWRSYEISDLAD